MDDYEGSGNGLTLLPGVDLALWIRLVVAVALLATAAAVVIAVY